MKRYGTIMILGALVTIPSWAGTYFEAKTAAQGGRGADAQRATVRGWVEGDSAKVEFLETRNPLLSAGGYMVTRDGGETLYFVDPKEKTYAKFDIQGMAQLAGGVSKVVNLKISNPRVEKLEERPGGLVLGLPTTYYKFRTAYGSSMSIMGFKSETQTESVQEMWLAPDLVGRAFGAWLRKEPPSMGDAELDKLVSLEMKKVQGVPLKTITTTTVTESKKGRTETTTVTMEVTKLQAVPVADSTFEIPASYTETQLLPVGGESQEGEANPLSKMFGGKKKS